RARQPERRARGLLRRRLEGAGGDRARVCPLLRRAGRASGLGNRQERPQLPQPPGSMRVISAEGRLQHGRAPAAALVDELWALETARERQTYIALSSALHKREDAYL